MSALLPDGYRAVPLGPERLEELLEVTLWTFPAPVSAAEFARRPLPLLPGRTAGVTGPDGTVVATHASHPFRRFPVPGGSAPAGGLTWVGVHPGHRRRGLLRAMVHEHLDHCREAGEVLSVLHASEPGIYGRFGYGLATRSVSVQVPRGSTLRDVPGARDLEVRLERFDPTRHEPVVSAVHGAGAHRPGWALRELPEQYGRHTDHRPWEHPGAEEPRIAVVERAGRPSAYAILRRTTRWVPAGHEGEATVHEVVAADPASARALWGVLLDLDLVTTVRASRLAVDDPLLHLLVDVRAATPTVQDNLWLRLVDVPAALAARRCAAAVDVVLDVRDALIPHNTGRWRVVSPGPETPTVVTTTDASADLELDVRELAAAYLGGTSLAALAAAGLVTAHHPGTLAAASTALGWPLAPVASWVF